jgi:hypothetical protein
MLTTKDYLIIAAQTLCVLAMAAAAMLLPLLLLAR